MRSQVIAAISYLAVISTLAPAVTGHSWIEQVRLISPDGTFTGDPGYPRAYVPRDDPEFSDTKMVYLIPPAGAPTDQPIADDLLICSDSQKSPNQTPGSPRLKAAAGSFIALRYQENGHVTMPQVPPGKAENAGKVYIYGTTDPQPTDTFKKIHEVWNADGTGGDKRGRLLATQTYDDSQCYQVNGESISTERQAQFPHEADELMGQDLWCQNDIALPKDAPSGKPYTLYWVWDWSTLPNVNPDLPKGKTEFYTQCMDIDITGGSSAKRDVGIFGKRNVGNSAVPALLEQLKGDSGGSGPASPPAASSAQSQPTSSAPSATGDSATSIPGIPTDAGQSSAPSASTIQPPSATEGASKATSTASAPAGGQAGNNSCPAAGATVTVTATVTAILQPVGTAIPSAGGIVARSIISGALGTSGAANAASANATAGPMRNKPVRFRS
ncbi:MAG: hypothetical protein M1837_004655 [Sclerophora amabilis]|nr:MAG: hypothetical protein M1837_004655 [Sclerophora amabilis]